MEPDFTIDQFKTWVGDTFPDNNSRAIEEYNFRDGLNKLADFVFQTNSTAFIQASIDIVQAYVDAASSSEAVTNSNNISVQLAKDLVVSLKTEIETIRNQALMAVKRLGPYDASTNTPALPTVPPVGTSQDPMPNGAYYETRVAGKSPIDGDGLVAGVTDITIGSRIIKQGNQWQYQPAVDSGYEATLRLEKKIPDNVNTRDWLFPFIDKSARLVGGFESDGTWYAKKYTNLSIPGSALKNSDIVLAKLAADVFAYFAKPSDLDQYAAAKTLYKNSPNTIDYGFPFTDKSGRLLGEIRKDGTFDFYKLKNNLPSGSILHSQLSDALLKILLVLQGEKMCSLGDSLTQGSTWQPTVAKLKGLVWSETETKIGKAADPYIPPMGIGGSAIIPIVRQNGVDGNGNPTYASGRGPGQSIYIRAGYVHLNLPKIITLWGGANDPIQVDFTKPSEMKSIWGEPTDAPYTGPELPEGHPNTPTFCAAYNGTLKKLIDNNPNARIVALTRMYANNVNPSDENVYNKLVYFNNLIKECCYRKSIPVIDIGRDSGIWSYNWSQFLPDGIHPTEQSGGGERIGRLVASKLY